MRVVKKEGSGTAAAGLMIKVVLCGKYRLVETVEHLKVLYLDDAVYLWQYEPGTGDVLVLIGYQYPAGYTLACGNYRVYEVTDEPRFSGHIHLELYLGDQHWQGYVLEAGLPPKHSQSFIAPTAEVITKKTSWTEDIS